MGNNVQNAAVLNLMCFRVVTVAYIRVGDRIDSTVSK